MRCCSKMLRQKKFRLLDLNHKKTFACKFTFSLLRVTYPHSAWGAPMSLQLHVSLKLLYVNTCGPQWTRRFNTWRRKKAVEAWWSWLERASRSCPAQPPPCHRIIANTEAGQPLAKPWKPRQRWSYSLPGYPAPVPHHPKQSISS